MRLIQGQFKASANSQGYLAPEWDQIPWTQTTVVFGCTYTESWDLTSEFGPGWVNLSQPAAAPNFHICNLELLDQQESRPLRCVWVMPDPGRITVFDHADRVLRWGVVQAVSDRARSRAMVIRIRLFSPLSDSSRESSQPVRAIGFGDQIPVYQMMCASTPGQP